ncbi:MAG TPA: RES family NAD+ phosphorylase [Gemmatimonadaceae bacterium]|nr:RES family NAD+ phosphorylase [Gemmatimonadaceae bacterium]
MLLPKRLAWKQSTKLVATIFPPVDVFEEVADAADLDALLALRARTNPVLNERIAPALAIPPGDRAYGPGAGYVMAPFAYPSPDGTRFGAPAVRGDSLGVYYAARDEATAIAEVKHHRVAFLRATRAPAQDLDFEVLKAAIKGTRFFDLRGRQSDYRTVYSPTDYSASQKLGAELRGRDADGIAYDSVRREGGECVAVFRPRCVGSCRTVKQLIFRWDGEAITAVLETRRLA